MICIQNRLYQLTMNLNAWISKVWWSSENEQAFWIRYDQARLLTSRLNDEQLFSPEVEELLYVRPENKLHACYLLFRSYALISAKSGAFEQRGFELLNNWKTDLDSLTSHLEEHLFPKLRGDDALDFRDSMRDIILHTIRLSEVVSAGVVV